MRAAAVAQTERMLEKATLKYKSTIVRCIIGVSTLLLLEK
jgi:hypothetical protein